MSAVPQHIGIIMDGNRRWAKDHDLATRQGHARGQEVLRDIAQAAFESGVKYLSVYAFSTENWRRTEEEVGYLMRLLVKGVDMYMQEFNDAGIRVVFLGRRDNLDAKILRSIEKAEQNTKSNEKGTLAICFNYGGHQEIVDVARQIVANDHTVDDIDEQMIEKYLYGPEIPPIDLIIRTSGEQRLSNFMLWRAAYSELYFVDKHWPDFTAEDLRQAVDEYIHRGRRFGA
jgi:undecaprenyl diphosphate synthase